MSLGPGDDAHLEGRRVAGHEGPAAAAARPIRRPTRWLRRPEGGRPGERAPLQPAEAAVDVGGAAAPVERHVDAAVDREVGPRTALGDAAGKRLAPAQDEARPAGGAGSPSTVAPVSAPVSATGWSSSTFSFSRPRVISRPAAPGSSRTTSGPPAGLPTSRLAILSANPSCAPEGGIPRACPALRPMSWTVVRRPPSMTSSIRPAPKYSRGRASPPARRSRPASRRRPRSRRCPPPPGTRRCRPRPRRGLRRTRPA